MTHLGRRPRVLLGVTIAGSLQFLKGVPKTLTDRGWDVHLVSAPPDGTEAHLPSDLSGGTIHRIEMSREPNPLADVRSLFAWVRLLRKLRPDVCVVGTPKAGLLGSLAARYTGVPVRIYQVRGLRLETESGLRRKVLEVMERAAFWASTSALVVSPSLSERLRELRLTGKTPTEVLGRGSSNGVDTDKFRPRLMSELERVGLRRDLGIPSGVPVIGFVGRLAADKGIEELLSACEQLSERGAPWFLLCCGSIEGGRVQERVSALSWPASRFKLLPPQSDIQRYYQVMDVLALPTYREGFPNVALEAAASGVPVVTTDATGAVDAVVPGLTGVVVPVGDAAALADALEELLDDEAARERMGSAGRERASEKFSRPVVQQNFAAYLRRSLETDRKSRYGRQRNES